MAYFITEECIACGVCEAECPESCITANRDVYVIDEEKCTECGACADACPVEAPQKK